MLFEQSFEGIPGSKDRYWHSIDKICINCGQDCHYEYSQQQGFVSHYYIDQISISDKRTPSKQTIPKHKNFYLQSTKGFWTPDKDKKLIQLVKFYGGKLSWNQLAYAFPGVKGKHIRQRYRNHLDPNLRQSPWTWEEDQILKKCYIRFGNCWEHIARHLPGRSANQVKNRIRKKQFRDLFQPTTPSGPVAKSYMPQSFKRPTILQQQARIQLKKEHNNKIIRDQVKNDLTSDLLQEVPMPPHMIRSIQKQKKKYTSKSKRFTITLLHLHNTYKIIRERVANKDTSQFFAIFERKNKKEIFALIQKIQWVITGLWPMLTNRNNTDTADQEMAFILFKLVESNSPLSSKILHRLMKCDNEEYLIKKFETLIQDMSEFIQFVSDNMRDKQILQETNQEELLKIDIQNDSEEIQLPQKKEQKDKIKVENLEDQKTISSDKGSEIIHVQRGKRKGKNRANEDLDLRIIEERSSKKKAMDLIAKQQENSLDYANYQRESLDNTESNKYDLTMFGKELLIANELDTSLLRDAVKKQAKDPVKLESKPRYNKKFLLQNETADNKSSVSRPESQYQSNDLDRLLNNLDTENQPFSSFPDNINEDQLDQSEQDYSGIQDLDFLIDIPQMQTDQQVKASNAEKNIEKQSSKGVVSEGEGQSDQNQPEGEDTGIMKSVYMRELLRKKIREIDSKQIMKIDLEEIEKARKDGGTETDEVKMQVQPQIEPNIKCGEN